MYTVKLFSDKDPSEQPSVAAAFIDATKLYRATDAFRTNLICTAAYLYANGSSSMDYEKFFFWVVSEDSSSSTSSSTSTSAPAVGVETENTSKRMKHGSEQWDADDCRTGNGNDNGGGGGSTAASSAEVEVLQTNKVVGIAMCTNSIFGLVLSPMPPAALSALFCGPGEDSIFTSYYDRYGKAFPSVAVPQGLEDEFLKIFATHRPHVSVIEGVKEIIYKLDNEKLKMPCNAQTGAPIPGRMRHLDPTSADTKLACQMYTDFATELMITQPDIDKKVEIGLKHKRFFVWMVNNEETNEEECVSFAGHFPVVGMGAPGEIGVARVAPVFTPIKYRNKGYAAILTAAVSRHMIENLEARVMLYTDAASVASNRAYTKIGYESVGRNTKFKLTYV